MSLDEFPDFKGHMDVQTVYDIVNYMHEKITEQDGEDSPILPILESALESMWEIDGVRVI